MCGNWLGFDMEGFTRQQVLSMNSYDSLLIELGEKSYMPSGSKWPVEVRLLFLVLMNTAVFIVIKTMQKKSGSDIMSLFNGMNGINSDQTTPIKKRKMKGPTVSVEDLPDVDDTKE